MPLAVVWLPAAMNAYRSLRVTDPEGASYIARRIAALAAEPRPEGSSCPGETDFSRLRLGQYRVLYEVTLDTVRVMHVGRVFGAEQPGTGHRAGNGEPIRYRLERPEPGGLIWRTPTVRTIYPAAPVRRPAPLRPRPAP